MLTHVIAILGLGLLCALWALLQRYSAKHHPEVPCLDNRPPGCGSCEKDDCGKERCEDAEEGPRLLPIARVSQPRN